jgi:hypothetical protein
VITERIYCFRLDYMSARNVYLGWWCNLLDVNFCGVGIFI